MAIKKIQKAFYISSEYVKDFIETRVEDLAVKTQRSSSYIIESILVDGLLPENKDAKSIIRNNLYPDGQQGGVQKTIDAAFSYNAAGLNWKSKHSNFKPLVEYCYYWCTANSTCKGKESYLPYFTSQLKSIVDRIENCANSCIETYDREMYFNQYEVAKYMLETAEQRPEQVIFRNYYELILNCWDMLDDWSITYRYLSALTVMGDFQENTSARNELYDVISEISKEW